MEFSSQEYWSGLLFPSLGDLPNQGIKPKSLSPALAGRFFITNTTWAENLPAEIKQLVRFVLNGNVSKLDIATGLLCFNQAAKIKVCNTRR